MAKRLTAAQLRGQAVYAERVAKAAAFTTRRFPSYAKASAADKKAARRIVDTIFGRETPTIDIKPILTRHTSVVHLVTTKRELAAAKKAAAAYDAPILSAWDTALANWRTYAKHAAAAGRPTPTPPTAPTIAHHFRMVKKADIPAIKKDIGQDTPRDVRAIFVRQEKLPTEDNAYSDGDLVRLTDGKWVTLKGWQVIIHRAIRPAAYATDPVREEARVMKQLRADFAVVAAHFKKTRGWSFTAASVMFAPQVGNHQYYDALSDEDYVHEKLAEWRTRYGADTRKQGSNHAPVTEWLTGINMILFLGQAGKQQHQLAWAAQVARRIAKKKARRRQGRLRRGKR